MLSKDGLHCICPPGKIQTRSGLGCIETPETRAKLDKEGEDRERRRAIRDYTDATLGDGFDNAAKVADIAGNIPGPAGRVFKLAGKIFEGVHDAYKGAKLVDELIEGMSQSEALAKGSKELLNKGEKAFTKAADPILDKILKRNKITIPEPVRKQIINKAREWFDKHIRDPAIDKGKEEFEEHMDPEERKKSLRDELERRGLWNNGLDQPTSP